MGAAGSLTRMKLLPVSVGQAKESASSATQITYVELAVVNIGDLEKEATRAIIGEYSSNMDGEKYIASKCLRETVISLNKITSFDCVSSICCFLPPIQPDLET